MHKALKMLRWLTALGTLLVLAMLAWQCIDIYLTGNSPANMDVNGIRLQAVFRMDDVAQRLTKLAMPMVIYAVLLLVNGILHIIFGQEKNESRAASLKKLPDVAKQKVTDTINEKKDALVRVALCGLAVLFIVLGVMNGGWYDVLVKAINICTECIGLG